MTTFVTIPAPIPPERDPGIADFTEQTIAEREQAAALLEAGFEQWSRETVYPAAVIRWIQEAGR